MYKQLLIAFAFFTYTTTIAQHKCHFEHLKCSHNHLTPKVKPNEDMEKYDVKFYFLDIEATNQSTAISGNTTIMATVGSESLAKFVVELHKGISVDSVLINSINHNFTHSTSNLISVDLNNPISANTNFTVQVFYKRPSTLNTDGVFSKIDKNWNKRVTYTLSETWHAANWFACKQDLLDKADSVYVFITVDENLKAGSNGLLTAITNVGENKHRYEWKSYYPIDFYLISIAIADYTEYNIYSKPKVLNGDSILIQNYLYNNYYDLSGQKEGIDATADLISLFSDKYSLYPFWKEKYGHSYAPLGGAMEHQTMTTTGSHEFYIIAHELGHQWFGNNVTCANWQDIWINEGFASYSEYLAYEFILDKAKADKWLNNAQNYARESKSGSVYVPFNEVHDEDRIFSWSLTYRKGLCLVHMIRKEMNNDELFFKTLQDFQLHFKDSNAIGDDFREFATNTSGIDFTNFFNEWYYGEGYPTYIAEWQQENSELKIKIKQMTTASSTPFFTNTIDFTIKTGAKDSTIRLKPTKEEEIFTIDFSETITKIEMDKANDILKGLNSKIEHNPNLTINEKISSFKCYPNPFNAELIFVSTTEKEQNIQIIDISGRVQYETNNTSKKIDTKAWSNGTYIVKVQTQDRTEIYKLVKN